MSLFLIYQKIFKFDSEKEPKKDFKKTSLIFPALLDVIATCFANAGLIYVFF